jgi:hypothetical protein
MADAWAALLGALIGGGAAIGGQLVSESYKRYRDRRGTAAAIAGEVSAITKRAAMGKTAEVFENLLRMAQRGEKVTFPNLHRDPMAFDPVYEKHLDKIGLLDPDVVMSAAAFYNYLQGLRVFQASIADGTIPAAPNVMKEMIDIWNAAAEEGNRLLSDLQVIAAEPYVRPLRLLKSRTLTNFVVKMKKARNIQE